MLDIVYLWSILCTFPGNAAIVTWKNTNILPIVNSSIFKDVYDTTSFPREDAILVTCVRVILSDTSLSSATESQISFYRVQWNTECPN